MTWLRRIFPRRPNARDNLSLIVEATPDSHAIAQFRIYRDAQVGSRLQTGLDTGSWAFGSERSPTRPSLYFNSVTGLFHRASRLASSLSEQTHKWTRTPTVTLEASHFAACPSTPLQPVLHSTVSGPSQGYRAAQVQRRG